MQLRQLVAPVGPGGPGGDSPSGRSQQRSPRHPLPPRRLSGRHRVTFTLQRRMSCRLRQEERNVSVHGNPLLTKQKWHLSQEVSAFIGFKRRRYVKDLWRETETATKADWNLKKKFFLKKKLATMTITTISRENKKKPEDGSLTQWHDWNLTASIRPMPALCAF